MIVTMKLETTIHRKFDSAKPISFLRKKKSLNRTNTNMSIVDFILSIAHGLFSIKLFFIPGLSLPSLHLSS